MLIQKSLRLQKLPPYIFSRIGKRKRELLKEGRKLIDLGMGDPDLDTPPSIVQRMLTEVKKGENHHYPPYQGIEELRQAISTWLDRRFSVTADADSEVMNLIGSKEGIANFAQAILNPGDFCLIPDPAYPVYTNAAVLAGATPVYYPLKAENSFRPNWSDIPEETWKSAKLIFINFPNNPTSATVELDTYRDLVEIAKRHDVIVCSDNPYSEQRFDTLAPCFLQAPGAKDVGVEFFSCSKSYNMTGWRIGFAAGHPELIRALYEMKSAIDTGVFVPIQYAAIEALLGNEQELIDPSKEVFKFRRGMMTEALSQKGYDVFDGQATFYLWIRTPHESDSLSFCSQLMEEHGIVATPGAGFGTQGEGYFRFSLTRPEEELRKAIELLPKT